ncbi:MAG: endonuclease/exonuclease/phosphatase family protein [Planctomycetota bacterium]
MDRLVTAGATLAVLASIAGFLGRFHWAIDLLGHQRRFYAVALLLAAVWLLVRRRWTWSAVAGLGLAINAWLLWPMYLGGHAEPVEGATTLRVVTFNVNTDNTNHAAVVDWLGQTDADVIAVLEVDRLWVESLKTTPGYRVPRSEPRSDNFGVAMLVRDPMPAGVQLMESTMHYHPDDRYRLPTLGATIRLNGRDLSLIAAHPLPPMGGTYAEWHSKTMRWLGELAAEQTGKPEIEAVVVAGDLNATPFSHAWPSLVDKAGLINSQRGHGWGATWPDHVVPFGLGIPIDHVLHSASLTTLDRQVGPSLGSDHHAVIVDLAWSAE